MAVSVPEMKPADMVLPEKLRLFSFDENGVIRGKKLLARDLVTIGSGDRAKFKEEALSAIQQMTE